MQGRQAIPAICAVKQLVQHCDITGREVFLEDADQPSFFGGDGRANDALQGGIGGQHDAVGNTLLEDHLHKILGLGADPGGLARHCQELLALGRVGHAIPGMG